MMVDCWSSQELGIRELLVSDSEIASLLHQHWKAPLQELDCRKRCQHMLLKKNMDKKLIPAKPIEKKTKHEVVDGKNQTNQQTVNDHTNGLIVANNLIPEEVLLHIFHQMDDTTLILCHLVCRRWEFLLKQFVWHKKAEKAAGQKLDCDTSWLTFYCIRKGVPFNRNLIENHSGERGLSDKWEVPPIKNINWRIESPPTPSLPCDPLFPGVDCCFITSSGMTWKYQIIDLKAKGFSSHLLDTLQPPIKVSEWFCCQEAPALYLCDIELLTEDERKKLIFPHEEDGHLQIVSDHKTYSRVLLPREQNQWFKYEYEIKGGYGAGLRKIKFIHGGRDKHLNYAGINFRLGAKMARACVTVGIPSLSPVDTTESFDSN